ncbi:MAG: hypothetical protein J6I40_01615 [Mailhella sp.]|nr:hypothetical protein [Mailhella sp.]
MRFIFKIKDQALKKDFASVFCAAVQLLFMGAAVTALFLVFLWDASGSKPFTEKAPTEIAQSIVLAASAFLYFRKARQTPLLRKALVLVGGLLGCMLIREQDYFLDLICHGFWKWPAFFLAFACIAYAMRTPADTLASLSLLTRKRGFPTLLTGLTVVLVYSRIFGTTLLWKTLIPYGDWRIAKYAVEESSELLGYLLILLSIMLLRNDNK